MVLWNYGAYELQQPTWHDNPNGTIVLQKVLAVTKISLLGLRPTQQGGIQPGTGNLANYSEEVKSWILEKLKHHCTELATI